MEEGFPIFNDFFCTFWQPLLLPATILVSSASSWVICGPTFSSAWNWNLLIDFWHQSWPHNSLGMLWGRQQLFSSLSAGSEKSYISIYFTLFKIISHWLFIYIFLWSVVSHSKKLILLQFFWTRKSRNATEQFSHPKERSCVQGLFFPNLGLWFTCKRLNFNFFASSWETARWNLPQAFALLQPLINLSIHLLLHILPSKKTDYALIISLRASESCRNKANRGLVQIISEMKIKTSIFSSVI